MRLVSYVKIISRKAELLFVFLKNTSKKIVYFFLCKYLLCLEIVRKLTFILKQNL